MDLSLERDGGTALGSLFQQIINDMKNTSPLWEDFVAKASKLHACLRAAIQAIGAYLDAFQKIADAATNSRGASKEIGTALTRVCLRHKAVETRLKTFTTAIMDCLVQPLQEKIDDWKRTVSCIDKEHAKEYKRCRTELKKRSSDTLRLQKKARKGQSDNMQSLMDSHMQDVTLRRAELEDVEKKSLRSVMIEERMRYCSFVNLLQPVVKEECEFMSELGHLQEAMQSIALVTKDPNILPQASEELIHDVKATITLYPESPGGGSGSLGACSNSLGSRKSSVCSISSMNSSGSSNSPGHHHYPRSLSQLIAPSIRLKPGESSDSGFCSTPVLTAQASSATGQTNSIATWPAQDGSTLPPTGERPHTISTAYEKGHQRPPLTVYTFENPETIHEVIANNGSHDATNDPNLGVQNQKSAANALNRPPLPVRCSSLERPLAAKTTNNFNGSLMHRQCPSPIPAHITNELSLHNNQQQQTQLQQQQQQQQYNKNIMQPQQQNPPTYANMSDLANMAALKNKNTNQYHHETPVLQQQQSIDSLTSQLSYDSATGTPNHQQYQNNLPSLVAQRTLSISSSSASSSNIASLHSQPSLDSAVATPLVGQTPTTSSGSSTPQNHYSPLINNSMSSTADGTPSCASIGSGILGNASLNNFSTTPPPPPLAQCGGAELSLKITEIDGHNKPNVHNDTDSPTIVENDERSRASVLQKASMFEKQAAAVSTPPSTTLGSRTSVDNKSSVVYGQQQDQSGDGGGGSSGSTRIARRASVNTAKPPPPVRRSSSVTPNPHEQRTTSFRTTSSSADRSSGGGNGIYAQPKIVTNMSSFRSSSPTTASNGSNGSPSANGHVHQTQPKANPNLIAQLNARLNSKQQQQHNENIYSGSNISNYKSPDHNEPIYMRANYGQQQQQQQQQQAPLQHHPSQKQQQSQSPSYDDNMRAKSKAEFLENLNAKLAKQGMSGRAYAVRNLINSKALPDPRICHESLMDQIKRGSTLKRNQKINDRSAPKIH